MLAVLRNRYATPFSMRCGLCGGAGRPFNTLPPRSRSRLPVTARWASSTACIFMAEASTTCSGLDSLLDPHGNIKTAMDKAAVTWNQPDLLRHQIDRQQDRRAGATAPATSCSSTAIAHKSHHYGWYLPARDNTSTHPLPQYAIYGACRCAPSSGRCWTSGRGRHRVRMLLLTNCTRLTAWCCTAPRQVMEELLAIKPDICFCGTRRGMRLRRRCPGPGSGPR